MSNKRQRGLDHPRSTRDSHRASNGNHSLSLIRPRRPINNGGESSATPGAGRVPEAEDYETELWEGEVEQSINLAVARLGDSVSFLHLTIEAKLAEAKERMGERTREQTDHEAQFETEKHLMDSPHSSPTKPDPAADEATREMLTSLERNMNANLELRTLGPHALGILLNQDHEFHDMMRTMDGIREWWQNNREKRKDLRYEIRSETETIQRLFTQLHSEVIVKKSLVDEDSLYQQIQFLRDERQEKLDWFRANKIMMQQVRNQVGKIEQAVALFQAPSMQYLNLPPEFYSKAFDGWSNMRRWMEFATDDIRHNIKIHQEEQHNAVYWRDKAKAWMHEHLKPIQVQNYDDEIARVTDQIQVAIKSPSLGSHLSSLQEYLLRLQGKRQEKLEQGEKRKDDYEKQNCIAYRTQRLYDMMSTYLSFMDSILEQVERSVAIPENSTRMRFLHEICVLLHRINSKATHIARILTKETLSNDRWDLIMGWVESDLVQPLEVVTNQFRGYVPEFPRDVNRKYEQVKSELKVVADELDTTERQTQQFLLDQVEEGKVNNPERYADYEWFQDRIKRLEKAHRATAETWELTKLDDALHILSEIITYVDVNGRTKSETLLSTLFDFFTQPDFVWKFHKEAFEGKDKFIDEVHDLTTMDFTDRQIQAFLMWCQDSGVLFRVIYRRLARRYDIVSAEQGWEFRNETIRSGLQRKPRYSVVSLELEVRETMLRHEKRFKNALLPVAGRVRVRKSFRLEWLLEALTSVWTYQQPLTNHALASVMDSCNMKGMLIRRKHKKSNEWLLIENGWEEKETVPIALFREERKRYDWFDKVRDIVVSEEVQERLADEIASLGTASWTADHNSSSAVSRILRLVCEGDRLYVEGRGRWSLWSHRVLLSMDRFWLWLRWCHEQCDLFEVDAQRGVRFIYRGWRRADQVGCVIPVQVALRELKKEQQDAGTVLKDVVQAKESNYEELESEPERRKRVRF